MVDVRGIGGKRKRRKRKRRREAEKQERKFQQAKSSSGRSETLAACKVEGACDRNR